MIGRGKGAFLDEALLITGTERLGGGMVQFRKEIKRFTKSDEEVKL